MGEIYVAATRAVVYIGEANPRSTAVFDDLERAGFYHDRGSEPDPPSSDVIAVLDKFVQRSWFTRV